MAWNNTTEPGVALSPLSGSATETVGGVLLIPVTLIVTSSELVSVFATVSVAVRRNTYTPLRVKDTVEVGLAGLVMIADPVGGTETTVHCEVTAPPSRRW